MWRNNDVTNRIGLVYAKTKTKLLGPIWLVWSMMKTRHDNYMTNRIGAVNTKNEAKLS